MQDSHKSRSIVGFLASNADAIFSVAKFVVPASFAGAVVAWAAWITGPLQQYAPASWVVAGLLSAFLTAVVILMVVIGREKLQRIRFHNSVFSASQINPLDVIFNGRRIRVVDLAPPIGPFIDGRTFIDCEIIGPANVMFDQCHFQNCGGEIVDGIVIKSSFQPRNGFGFRGCTFTRCRFYLMTFMVPEPDFQFFLRNHSGLNWITERPDQPSLPISGAPVVN